MFIESCVYHTLLILNSGCEVLKSMREALATQGTCTVSAMSVCRHMSKINETVDENFHISSLYIST